MPSPFYRLLNIAIIALFISPAKAQIAKVQFEYFERLIFVEASVNNSKPLLFLVDTGANTSAIDSKTADRLGIKTLGQGNVMGSAGTISVDQVFAESISIQDATVKNLEITKYDLSGSLAPEGKRLDGILGTDFLKNFALEIDFIQKQIAFYGSSKNCQNGFEFEMENGIPRVKAILNASVETYLRYDSGSSLFDTKDVYINVTKSVFEEIGRKSELKLSAQFGASGVGGNMTLDVYRIHSLTFGSREIEKPFIIVQPRQGYFADPKAVGFFGNNLLEKFGKATIDFIGKRICVD